MAHDHTSTSQTGPAKTTLPEPAKRKNLVNEKALVALFPDILTVSALRMWRSKRIGPIYYKILNKRVLYCPEEVQGWLEAGRIDPEGD